MEIFAQIDDNTRLVKVTTQELMLIMGYSSRYDEGFHYDYLKVGHKIDIEKFSKVTANLKNLHTNLLKEIHSRLQQASGAVGEAIDVSNEINCFEKLKGEDK